jgi:8-oxo-dGTP diphosphatase
VREVVEETGLAVRIVGERARHSWMDLSGRDQRVHAQIFDVVEEQARDVVLNADEHDAFVWTADTTTLNLAAHFLVL